MKLGLGKAKLNSLIMILDSGASSIILLGKHTKKTSKKNTKPFRWKNQVGVFHINYQGKVEIVLPGLYAMKSITWDLHVDDSHGNHK